MSVIARAWLSATLVVFAACGASNDGPSGPASEESGRRCGAADGIELSITGELGLVPGAPMRRVVLMGGAAEVDGASRAFVEAARGGDVLVLRATGSTTSYNDYFHSGVDPDPRPSSVSTIRIDQSAASSSRPVLCRVGHAEAVWLAGGDQWDYLGEWDSALHEALSSLAQRQASIGGTSAGAVVMGEAAFDARYGSVDSQDALADPLRQDVSVVLSPLAQAELRGWIVDSHFAQRGREGRLLAFLARMLPLTDRDTVYGLGLDERAALVIADGEYQTMASSGRHAWLYRVVGPVPLVAGEPLDIVAQRIRLDGGDAGAWPVSFAGADTVRVVDGVVGNGIQAMGDRGR